MAIRTCSSAHCRSISWELADFCADMGVPVSTPAITRDEQGVCACSCSCLAFGTMVQEGNGSFKAIETYVEGDEVLAAGTGLTWAPASVVF
ncbi:hypothetical protein PUR49_00660, partial [Streptomyces sp. BE147]|uniref:hypothetical protein n=1 Tax=Streptomyces sp. BE147 TaxID=3002524 RepID=UPI002E75B244